MTHLIGIAGASGSGKTTLAAALADALGATVIAEDDYYLCSSLITDFDPLGFDFDAPAAKDMARLATDLEALRAGRAIEKPLYDFFTHTRRWDTESVAPAPYIIVEGILALADPAVRALYDLAIWIETPDHLCLDRRVHRDVAERGRDLEGVLLQYERFVRPAFLAHAPVQRSRADLVIDAEAFGHDIAAMVNAARARL